MLSNDSINLIDFMVSCLDAIVIILNLNGKSKGYYAK